METCQICNVNEKSHKQLKLENSLAEVEKITDKLGKGIDDGIKEAIAIFRAMELETSSSCAGHTEDKLGLPYVEMYTPAPIGWNEDRWNESLRNSWKETNNKQRQIIEPLLEEFNSQRNTPTDVRLHLSNIGLLGGFRIQNVAGIEPTNRGEAIRKIIEYQAEMAAFTDFIKRKFLESN